MTIIRLYLDLGFFYYNSQINIMRIQVTQYEHLCHDPDTITTVLANLE